MTHLRIEQGSSVENISEDLMKKLYNITLDITPPEQGEEDNAYLSGHIAVPYSYKYIVDYLAGTIGEGTSGIVTSLRLNAQGRFLDLRIDVLNDYYILFEDPNVEAVIVAMGVGSSNGITMGQAASALLGEEGFKNNTDITRFNEFKYFTEANTGSRSLLGLFSGCANLSLIDLSELTVLHKNEFKGTGISTVNAPKLSTLGASNADAAFDGCTNLTSVLNLGTIVRMPYQCFQSCTNLLSVNIPATCTSFANDVFKSCSNLTTVNIPDPSVITAIGASAFHGCNKLLLDVSLYNNITTMGDNAFANAYEVTGIVNMPNYSANKIAAFTSTKINKVLCVGTASEVIGFSARSTSNDHAKLTEVYLPFECTKIRNFAYQKNLTVFKQYDKTISAYEEGESKTYMSDLSKITEFGSNCFRDCTSLLITTADIRNATVVGEYAFANVLLSGVLNLPYLNTLLKLAFYGTGISSITSLGGSITTITLECFNDCSNLTSVSLSPQITILERACFQSCSGLTTVGNSFSYVTSINEGSFDGCSSLLELNFPNLTTIGNSNYGHTFRGCSSLIKVTLGHLLNLTTGSLALSLTRAAFGDCTSLKIVDFGDSITQINPFNFMGCSSLKAVIIRNTTPPTFQNRASNDDIPSDQRNFNIWFGDNLADIYVPDAAVNTYKAAVGFSLFPSRIKSLNEYNETDILNS